MRMMNMLTPAGIGEARSLGCGYTCFETLMS